MTQETQEDRAMTQEQRQRAEAALTAGQILRVTEASKGPLVGRGDKPGTMDDIVDLTNYIVTGNVYSVQVMREDADAHPQIHFIGDLLAGLAFTGTEDGPGQEEPEAPLAPDFDDDLI